jgi:hypothetical protein
MVNMVKRFTWWFQNLNDRKKNLFHFRGALKSSDWRKEYFHYEVCSGPSFKFQVKTGYKTLSLTIGFLFFTLYLTIPFFIKFNERRQYGFYFFEWNLVFNFGQKEWESSSKDPWYYYYRIDILKVLFGKPLRMERRVFDVKDRYFKFRNQEYKMDTIEIFKESIFRSRIPYSSYHKTYHLLKIDIKNPPGYAGKGENSWDCDDDATYGLSTQWVYDTNFSWNNREKVAELAISEYLKTVSKHIKKYGRSSDDTDLPSSDTSWSYVGVKNSIKFMQGDACGTQS